VSKSQLWMYSGNGMSEPAAGHLRGVPGWRALAKVPTPVFIVESYTNVVLKVWNNTWFSKDGVCGFPSKTV